MAKTLLLTGHPTIGKTTIIRKVIKSLGDQVGGFYIEEIFGAGGRQGFNLFTLDGQKAVVAHKDIRGPKVLKIGRYGIDIQTLDTVGVAAIRRAMEDKKIIIVDEIGKLVLYSPAFRETLMMAIFSPAIIFGSIIYTPHPEADAFKSLAQVTLWEVDKRNRDTMPEKALKWLKKAL